MGKHFDGLVDIVKDYIGNETIERWRELGSSKDYLSRIVRQAKLFEFPFNSKEIFPRSEKKHAEYMRYCRDYFDISEQYGRFFITPFKVTAIEDEDSVVILDHVDKNKFRVITAVFNDLTPPRKAKNIYVSCNDVTIEKPTTKFSVSGIDEPAYFVQVESGIRCCMDLDKRTKRVLARGIHNDVVAYIQQAIYIMDPEVFIIRKENNASVKQGQRDKKGRRPDLLKKTIMRPHFTCLNWDETRDFLVGDSKEPYPAHPVIGHRKFLKDERYKKMRYQWISVSQHFTGEGKVIARGGWNYEVWLKKNPVRIVPYYNDRAA